MVLLYTPTRLLEKGKIIAIFLAGAISATAGFSLTGVVAYYLGIEPTQVDVIVGIGWIIGFFSLAIFNLVANFFANRQEKDIVEVYEEVQSKRQVKTPKAKK